MAFSFGAPAQSTAGQKSNPFSFGSNNASTSTPAQPQQAGATGAPSFSFGSTSTNNQPGQNQQQQQQQQQQPASTGFSFGSQPAQPAQASQPAAGGFSFGAQPQSNQQGQAAQPGQQAQAGSLFAPKPAGTTASFGFGQPAASTSTSTFGQPASNPFGQPQSQAPANTNTFGFQSTTQNQQQGIGQQGQTQGQGQAQQGQGQSGGLTKTTKFSDLSEPLQKELEGINNWINQQKQAATGIDTDNINQAIRQTSASIKGAVEHQSAIRQTQVNIDHQIQTLKSRLTVEESEARNLRDVWDAHQPAPGEGRTGGVRSTQHREWPVVFFSRVAGELDARVERYKKSIAELNRVVAGLANESERPSPQAVAQTIQNHQNGILALAAQLERLELRMGDLRDAYSAEFKQRFNTMRDPFDVAREEKGIAPVSRA